MIPAAKCMADFHAGYVVLTSAENERPFLVHVNEIDSVSFTIDGGEPHGIYVCHDAAGDCVETIVYEGLEELLALVKAASRCQVDGQECSSQQASDEAEWF